MKIYKTGGTLLFEDGATTIKETVENAVKQEVNLSSANLSSANLSSANLSFANLRSANLSFASLSSANLSSANLSSANLSSADLRSADLRFANLWSANLSSADLWSANLNSANLWSANLWSANLSSANLSDANLRSANLWSADLSYAKYNISSMLLASWGDVSDVLCTNLMRLDAESIPDGNRLMSIWAKGGNCPYKDIRYNRVASFEENKKLWKPGRPMSLWNIWKMLAKENNIKISLK